MEDYSIHQIQCVFFYPPLSLHTCYRILHTWYHKLTHTFSTQLVLYILILPSAPLLHTLTHTYIYYTIYYTVKGVTILLLHTILLLYTSLQYNYTPSDNTYTHGLTNANPHTISTSTYCTSTATCGNFILHYPYTISVSHSTHTIYILHYYCLLHFYSNVHTNYNTDLHMLLLSYTDTTLIHTQTIWCAVTTYYTAKTYCTH